MVLYQFFDLRLKGWRFALESLAAKPLSVSVHVPPSSFSFSFRIHSLFSSLTSICDISALKRPSLQREMLGVSLHQTLPLLAFYLFNTASSSADLCKIA